MDPTSRSCRDAELRAHKKRRSSARIVRRNAPSRSDALWRPHALHLCVRVYTWCVHMAEAGNRTACDACCRGRDAVPCVMHRRFVRLLQCALEPLVQPRSTLFASTRPLSVRARISRGKVYSDRHASGETEVYEYEHRASSVVRWTRGVSNRMESSQETPHRAGMRVLSG